MIAFTIEAKLPSMRIMSEASLATSVPAIPIEDSTLVVLRAGPLFVLTSVTTISPRAEGFNEDILVLRGRSGQDLDFDSVGLSGRAGLVALDIVAGDEDTVTRDNLTGLEKGNVTNGKFLHIDDTFDAAADNLDTSLLLLVVENAELFLLLPVVEGTNHHL